MISKFLSKLLFGRQADFTEENIKILELFFVMQPVKSLIKLQVTLEKKFGEKGRKMMKEFGKNISSTLIKHLKSRVKLNKEQLRKVWLDMFSLSGFGKLEVVKLDSHSAIFQTNSNEFARQFLKHKKQKKPVCLITQGMLEGYVKEITGKNVKCNETSCIARGKKFCTFEFSY